jgi:hypothetical protein
MNQVIYESGLEEFRQFNERAIQEALEPYAAQIQGKWMASTILENIEASYARVISLLTPRNRAPRSGVVLSYDEDESLEEVATHLAGAIDQEVYHFFRSQSKRPIYVIDLHFLKQIILKKTEEIQKENLNKRY